MSFLSPLFLAGVLAAAVPLVLHLLKRHTEQRVPFAAVALLKGAPVEHSARRKLRERLLLALRAGALVLLALAFARPFFPSATGAAAGLSVVALDTSLSMSSPATLARARQLASDAVRLAPATDDVAVVTFSDHADAIVKPTSSRREALAAIAGVRPGYGATSYAEGLAAAGELFRGRRGSIAVVTDLQANGWDAGRRAAVPDAVRVDVKDVGAPAGNIAVEAVRSDGDRVVAVIRNTNRNARDIRARLTVDGRAAGETTVNVGARGAADATFANVRASGAAVVRVDDPSGIPGDDARYALVGSDAPAAVLVVTASGDLDKDAWYVRHALDSVRGASAADPAWWSDETLSRYGAVFLLSTRGLERRAREALAAYANGGGGVLIAAGPDVDGEVVADVLGAASALDVKTTAGGGPERVALRLAPADVRHPIFRAFGAEVASLGLVQFRNVARVSGRTCQPIARFTSGDPGVLDCVVGNGRAIVVASDLNNRWNDFPIRASFVPFLDQAARYLSNTSRRGHQYLVGEVPAGVAPVPGVTTVNAGAGARRIVVNVDPRESEADRMAPAEFQASIARLRDTAAQDVRVDIAAQENRQHLWTYLLMAMVVALVAEGFVAARMA